MLYIIHTLCLRNDVLTYCHIILKIYTRHRDFFIIFSFCIQRRNERRSRKKRKKTHPERKWWGGWWRRYFPSKKKKKLFKHRLPYIFKTLKLHAFENYSFYCVYSICSNVDYGVLFSIHEDVVWCVYALQIMV